MNRQASDVRWLGLTCVAVVLVHLSFAGRYGFFRDELYFIACGSHPSPGYVDQPPLTPLLAAAWDALVGGSLLGFRVLPALFAGALSLVTGLVARELGGGGVALLLAAVGVAVGPVFLVAGHLFTMNMLEPLLWTWLVLLVLRQLHGPRSARWLEIGLLVGVGLSNKYSMAFWALALMLGLLATRQRKVLASVWVAAAITIAIALPLPSLWWQAERGWPFLALLRAGASGKNAPFEAASFLSQLVLQVHPLTLPLWFAGLRRAWRSERWLALAFLGFIGLMFALEAKVYYVAPAFPALLAAGAAELEGVLLRARWRLASAFALLCSGGALTAPLVVPILPVEALVRYQRALGVSAPPLENREYGELPQHLADQFGWPEIGAAVSAVWRELPASDRAHAAAFTLNYGDAAAIARFGGVPAISGHNHYAELGPEPADGTVLLVFGSTPEWLGQFYASIERVGTGPSSPFMMPYERARPIWLVRQPKLPLQSIWRAARHID